MYRKYIKRLLDCVFAVILLVVLLLPMVIIGLITWIDTKEPVIFAQKRSGRYRKPFVLYKFRTMPQNTKTDLSTAETVGIISVDQWQHFLRQSSLDELPQLLNIIKGDMSFVGPRPVICRETDLIEEREKYGANAVRPGLTGWAQVNGRDAIDYKEKSRLDGEYVKELSFLFDAKCIIRTVSTVFTDKGI